VRVAFLVVFLVGCFEPVVPTGVPCSMTGECPQGQLCDRVRNLCGAPPIDASILDAGEPDGPIDAPLIDAPPLGPWGQVLPITQLNTPDVETDPAISADGLELFFSSDRPGGPGSAGDQDLYVATRTNAALAFGAPSIVTELATAQIETAPYLTPDGLTLYFTRAGQIQRATRPSRTSPFTSVVAEPALSSALYDVNPALSPDGLTASVTREITVIDRDMYLFTRSSIGAAWSAGSLMVALQTNATDSGAEFTTDPLELYFHSDRAGSAGTDIYRATRASTSDEFGSPTRVIEISTSVLESDPSITADRRLMIFERQQNLMYTVR